MGIYVANSDEKLISGVASAGTINTEDTVLSGDFKKQKEEELKQNWNEKKMHGQFVRECQRQLIRIRCGNVYQEVN